MTQPEQESEFTIAKGNDVSVVIPAHNEADALPDLIDAILHSLESVNVNPTVIVVDDGSTDRTAQYVLQHRAADTRVHLIRLSRNFGHQPALLAGLRSAPGDAVICMDGDGQHPPSVLPELVEAWRAGANVVNTLREDSHDVGALKRITSRLFYRCFAFFTGLRLERGMADFRLFDRSALTALLSAEGKRPFIRGTAIWIGFDQATIRYRADPRRTGESSYSLRSMWELARDGIIGFSSRPLWMIGGAGFACSLLAFAFALYGVVVGLVSESAVPGWASTVAIFSGLQCLLFLSLGMLNLYVAALSAQTGPQPEYIVNSSSLVDQTSNPTAP